MSTRHVLGILVLSSTLLRLGWAVALGPGNDEAYYALFTVHPDWSYHDHPPLVALVESLGLNLAGDWDVPGIWALRLGFVGLFAGSTLLMARLAGRFYGPRAGLLAALLFNAAPYFGAISGTFALPDGPLIFFWLWTLDRLAACLDAPERLGRWAILGLAWGGALLSKYHAVFLPIGAAFYLVLEPPARRCLRTPGPYLALGLGLLAFAPVIGWNATHGWVSFAFQGGRAVGDVTFRPLGLLVCVGGQALYLLPWIWAALGIVLIRALRRQGSGRGTASERFLIAQAVGPLGLFLAVSCVKPVLPHWPLVGFLSVFPMAGHAWAERWDANPSRNRRRAGILLALPVILGTLLAWHARAGLFQRDGRGTLGLVATAGDPSLDPYGWRAIVRELRRRGLLDREDTFLFTSKWYYSGQLAFALRDAATPVLCYNAGDARGFAQWSQPDRWLGHDGILLVVDPCSTEPACYDRWFRRIEPLGRFAVRRAGVPVRWFRLYRCVQQVQPFPFDERGD